MKILDIGEVSQRTGVRPSTLRYYEEIGLVAPVTRHGLRRQYGPEVLMQLALIALGRTAGFTLSEIGAVFGANGAPNLPRQALHERADALDEQIRRLETLRRALRHVADCPARSHMECAKFRRILRMAARHVPPDERAGRPGWSESGSARRGA